MANVKITDLAELTGIPDDTDLLGIVDDVAVTPTSKKITVGNLRGGLAASGANADITSMTGLADDGIPLAKVANAASDGANADITSMTGLNDNGIPLAKVANAARNGANADITSMTGLADNGIPVAKVAGALQLSSFQKARAYLNTAQSVASGSGAKVLLDTTSFDPSSIVDTVNNRIKPTKAGYYQVNGAVGIALGAVCTFFAFLSVNGSEISRGSRYNGMSGNVDSVVSDIISLNGSTDYIEFFVYQNTGSDQTLETGSAITYLSIVGPF